MVVTSPEVVGNEAPQAPHGDDAGTDFFLKDQQYLLPEVDAFLDRMIDRTFEQLETDPTMRVHNQIAEKLALKSKCKLGDNLIVPVDELLPPTPMAFERFLTERCQRFWTFAPVQHDKEEPAVIQSHTTMTDLKRKLISATKAHGPEESNVEKFTPAKMAQAEKGKALMTQVLQDTYKAYAQREELLKRWQECNDESDKNDIDPSMRRELMSQVADMQDLVQCHRTFGDLCAEVTLSEMRELQEELLKCLSPWQRLQNEVRQLPIQCSLLALPLTAIGVDYNFEGWVEEQSGVNTEIEQVDSCEGDEEAYSFEIQMITKRKDELKRQLSQLEKKETGTKGTLNNESAVKTRGLQTIKTRINRLDIQYKQLLAQREQLSKAESDLKTIRSDLGKVEDDLLAMLQGDIPLKAVWGKGVMTNTKLKSNPSGGTFTHYSGFKIETKADSQSRTESKNQTSSTSSGYVYDKKPGYCDAAYQKNAQNASNDNSGKDTSGSSNQKLFYTFEAGVFDVSCQSWDSMKPLMLTKGWQVPDLGPLDINKPPHRAKDGSDRVVGMNARYVVKSVVISQKVALLFDSESSRQSASEAMKAKSNSSSFTGHGYYAHLGAFGSMSGADAESSGSTTSKVSAEQDKNKSTISEGNMRIKFFILEKIPLGPLA